jgi:hypothetical protein
MVFGATTSYNKDLYNKESENQEMKMRKRGKTAGKIQSLEMKKILPRSSTP